MKPWIRLIIGRVTGIRLQIVRTPSSGRKCNSGKKLSFLYEGILVKKNGELMKNRKPEVFWDFVKDDIHYCMSSYHGLRIRPARMY